MVFSLVTDEVIDEERELSLLEPLSRVILAGVVVVAAVSVILAASLITDAVFHHGQESPPLELIPRLVLTSVPFVAVFSVVLVVVAVAAVPAVTDVSVVACGVILHNQEVSPVELFSRVVLLRRVYFPEWGSCVIPPQSREEFVTLVGRLFE